TPSSRRVVDSLLLAGCAPGRVAELGALFNLNLSEESVAHYAHYFWDRELLSQLEWHDYFEKHPSGWFLRFCYQRGEKLTLWKLGYRGDVAAKDAVGIVYHESIMRFEELGSQRNDHNLALAGKLWAGNVFEAIEHMSRSEDAVRAAMDGVVQVALRLGRREISSIESLADLPALPPPQHEETDP
ncbi:MAG: hypothetical protein ACOYOB_20795, partial [Myxococcota bacterium]